MFPVLRELRSVLTEIRHPEGQEERATKSEVSGRVKKGESVVRRFEAGETAPNYDELDDFIEAYAAATETDIFDLWDQAIKRAKKAPAGITPTEAELTEAELAAEHHKAELRKGLPSQPQPSRTSDNRSAKSGRGSRKK